VCQDPTPFDGRWSCGWNATLANGGTPPSDGQVFDLQLVATDGYGQSSPTSASWSFVVDSVSPDVAYDGATRTAYSNTLVSETSLTFSGLITDNHGVGRVEVCLDGRCGPASLQAPGRASAVVTDVATTPATVLGCGGGELVRTFTVTDSFTVGRVELGVTIDHERRSDIVAVLTSPDSTTVQVLGPPVGTASEAGNYDVLLYDGAGTGLHELWVSDDTAPPHYDRSSRPYAPLDAFRGGSAAGTWTLTICDSDPVTKTGTYRSSRLTLVPDDTAATSGAWSYSPPKLGEIDGEARTVAATGYDLVGNQSTAISLTFVADNVAPALQVTEREELMRLMPDRSGTRVISGTVTDGSTALDRAVHMYAFVKPPASATGSARNLQVSRQGDVWWLELSPAAGGRYTIWINAADSAGNVTTVGPYYVTVVQLTATADSPALPAASTTLTATLRGADSQDYTFEWDPGDDSSSLTGAVVDHTYSALGTYTATVTATQGTHLFTATTQVRVVEAITGLAAANDGPTTLGEVTALTATVTTGGAVDYTWDLGDGTLTNGGVAYHTYGATGTYAAIVTATQGAQVFTATTEVRVVAPITGVTAVNDSPTALGTATALTATVSPSGAVDGVDGVDYTWDLGDGAFAGGSSVRHTYGTVGAYTATVTATQGIEVFTATTRVEVLEAITGLTAVNDSPTALGEATILTATVAGGGDVIYTWHLGDGTLAGGSVVQHVYPTDGFYAAVVTATNKVSTMSATTQVIVGDVDIARTYMPLVFRSSRGATSREIYLPLLMRSNDNR
jgi:subtilisin-like proprotein convertase family protein/PKD repeat protein